MRRWRRMMRRVQAPHRRQAFKAVGITRLVFVSPWTSGGDIAWRAFLQQKFRRLDDWLAVKARAHLSIQQRVGNGDNGHALMVRHEGANDRVVHFLGQARACVVQRLVEAVTASPARRGKAAYVKQGQSIRIVNKPGRQVVAPWTFTAGMLTEFMSMEHTRATLTKLITRPGDGR